MKRVMNRVISMLVITALFVVTFFSCVPGREVQAANGVYNKLISLQSKFPDGKYWNHVVPASEAYWDCCTHEGYADSVTNHACTHHGYQPPEGAYECSYFDGGWQCCGFARKVFYDVFGERIGNWDLAEYTNPSGLQVGDYVKLPGNPDHYAVALSVGASTFTVVECNAVGSNCRIDWGRTYNKSQIVSYIRANNYNSVNGGEYTPTISVSWSQYSSQEIREGKVFLAKTATLSGATMNDVSDVGIDVYNSSNTYLTGKSEVPDRSGHTYVHIWYDFASELGLSIAPGTVYKYSFWVRINGKKYESSRETVTCPGNVDILWTGPSNDFYAYICPSYTDRKIEAASSNNNVQLTAGTTSVSDKDPGCIWRFVKQSDGSFAIYNERDGKCLEAAGGGTTSGTNVQTYSVQNLSPNQLWFIYESVNGVIIKSANCNLVLDVQNKSADAGTNIILYGRHNEENQRFSIRVINNLPTFYTVKFDANGGNPVSDIKVCENGVISSLPQTTRNDYVFDGWFTSKTGGTELITNTIIAGNVTYYAHWHGEVEIPNNNFVGVTVSSIPDMIYTGNLITPVVTVKDGNKTLTKDIDYVVATYQDNRDVGRASIRLDGKGEYSGSKWVYFNIVPASIVLEINDIEPHTYTGLGIEPSIIVTYGSVTLIKNKDYSVVYSDNIHVGSATVKVSAIGNFTGSKTLSFEITPKSITSLTVEPIDDQEFTGSAITPSVTVVDGTKTLVLGTDYTVSYADNTDIGTATVAITGIGNYAGTKNVTFNIVEPAVVPDPSTPAQVLKSSIALNDMIGINYFLSLPDEFLADSGAYVTVNGNRCELMGKDSQGRYPLTYSVAAAEMRMNLVLRLCRGDGTLYPLLDKQGVDVTSTGFIYSVATYINEANASGRAAEDLLLLLNRMGDYGKVAQIYFNNDAGLGSYSTLAGDIGNVSLDNLSRYYPVITKKDNMGIRRTGSTLELRTATVLNHRFVLDSGKSISDYKFYVDGKLITTASTGDVKLWYESSSGKYVLSITNIAAAQLQEKHDVTVTNQDGEVVISITNYSALSYAYTVISQKESDPGFATLVKLLKAMYLYNRAAMAYFKVDEPYETIEILEGFDAAAEAEVNAEVDTEDNADAVTDVVLEDTVDEITEEIVVDEEPIVPEETVDEQMIDDEEICEITSEPEIVIEVIDSVEEAVD